MNINSPYFTGAAPNFGPPGGLASLLQQGQDQQINMNGIDAFAQAADQYKQLQFAGKSADYFFKANPDAMAAAGIHPDQLPTMSAQDKSAAAAGVIKAQGQQELIDKLQQIGQQNAARTKFQTFVQENPGATPEDLLKAGVQSGLNMDDVARLGQGMSGVERGFNFNPQTDVTPIPGMPGSVMVKTSRGGGRVVQDAGEQLLQTKPKAEDVPQGFVAVQAGKGWKVVEDPTQFETVRADDMLGGVTTTKRFVGRRGAPAEAPGTPSAAPAATPQGGGQIFTDKTGKKFRYVGSSANPKGDRNPANWQLIQ